ncbi:MAG: translation initiation factor IF-3, partial [Longimicrobiales bacterium]
MVLLSPFGPSAVPPGPDQRAPAEARPGVRRVQGTRTVSGSLFIPGGSPITTDKQQRTRVNRQIRISPVRVIASDGEQLGILPIEEALATAEGEGLDLVEVAPNARPPVVRIMDYGKYKYEEAR